MASLYQIYIPSLYQFQFPGLPRCRPASWQSSTSVGGLVGYPPLPPPTRFKGPFNWSLGAHGPQMSRKGPLNLALEWEKRSQLPGAQHWLVGVTGTDLQKRAKLIYLGSWRQEQPCLECSPHGSNWAVGKGRLICIGSLRSALTYAHPPPVQPCLPSLNLC